MAVHPEIAAVEQLPADAQAQVLEGRLKEAEAAVEEGRRLIREWGTGGGVVSCGSGGAAGGAEPEAGRRLAPRV